MITTTASHLQLVPPTPAADGGQPNATNLLKRLTAAADHLASIDPFALDADHSLAVARAVESVARAAEATLIRCVRTWHDRGDPVQTPCSTEEEISWRAWGAARKALVVDLGRGRAEAGRLIATAKALRRDPPTEEALRGGEISVAQARIIVPRQASGTRSSI